MPEITTKVSSDFYSARRTTASGPWEPSPHQPSVGRPAHVTWPTYAGMAVILAVSSLTTGVDLWLDERRRQATSVQRSWFVPFKRQYVSMAEARRIALEILAQADAERLLTAAEEARRDSYWESFS